MGLKYDKDSTNIDPPTEFRVWGGISFGRRFRNLIIWINLLGSAGNRIGAWFSVPTLRANLPAAASVLFFLAFFSSCQLGENRKSDIEIEFMLDTLNVGYTYWWPESGPFIGNCGQELSLVFSGIVTDLEAPTNEAGPLYTPQKGTITIERVFKIKELDENTYKNQRFVATDCFYESGLGTGDTVLVVCYDYENAYTIPGAGSILKIDSFDGDAIKSIRKYIDADENPEKIEKDIGLWASYGYGRALEQTIECRQEMKDKDTVDPMYIE